MSLEGLQFGHYRLMRQIGSGGMGEIYLAEDTRITRQVAVKVVRNEPSSYPDEAAIQESARLFRREMKAIASLDNPHILVLIDFGEETINRAMITYMVMPYRPEGSLNDWLSQHASKLSLTEIDSIIKQAADALQHAHDNGIIHQDVKPSNFLIRARRDMPNLPDLLLADFGIAKLLNATSAASQTSRGTATYMPPEQWDSNPVPATDQYALATMAYLLLTGRTPFQGRLEQVMRQQFMNEPQPPSKLNPEISEAVDKVILHALAKKPEDRFASVSKFANAFQQALQTTSPQPISEPTVYNVTPLTPVLENVIPTVPSSEPLAPTIPASGALAPIASVSEPLTPTIPASGPLVSDANTSESAIPATRPPKSSAELLTPAVPASSDTPPPTTSMPSGNTVAPPLVSKGLKSRTSTTVLAALAFLVIVGSIVGITAYQNNVNRVNADATANAEYIDSQNATATSQAIDEANATATSQAIDQANADATASVVAANPYPSYLGQGGTLAFYDSLGQSGGSLFDNKSGCQFTNGAYYISVSQKRFFQPCYEGQTFSNFAFEVQMTIVSGDCGGMLFRTDEASGKTYQLQVCQDGTDSGLRARTGDSVGQSTLISCSALQSMNIALGQSNTIAVAAYANTISIYINEQLVCSPQDSSYSQGSLALLAADIGSQTEVSFSNAKVWTL